MKPTKELIARIRAGLASEQEMREIGRDNVLAIKSEGEVMHFRFSLRKRGPSSLNETERTVEHVASDEDRDRMGDRISVKGWDLDNFAKNSPLLWDHDSSLLPIGRVFKARKGRNEDTGKPALMTVSRFHDAEKNPHAELVYRMVADGDMPAVSVGFNPIEIQRPASDEEAKSLGLGEFGVYFKRQELLELSVVSVPAHPGALAKKLDGYAERGIVSYEIVNEFVRRLAEGWNGPKRVFAVKKPVQPCEIIDELSTERAADAEDRDVEFVERDIDANFKRIEDSIATLGVAVRDLKENSGFDASARMVRSIVREEIGAALRAVTKTKPEAKPKAPEESPAGSGENPERDGGKGRGNKTADVYAEALIGGLAKALGQNA